MLQWQASQNAISPFFSAIVDDQLRQAFEPSPPLQEFQPQLHSQPQPQLLQAEHGLHHQQLQLQQFLPNGSSIGSNGSNGSNGIGSNGIGSNGMPNGGAARANHTMAGSESPQYQQYRPPMPLEIDPAHVQAGESLLAKLANGSPHGHGHEYRHGHGHELPSESVSPAAAAHRTNIAIEHYLSSHGISSGSVGATEAPIVAALVPAASTSTSPASTSNVSNAGCFLVLSATVLKARGLRDLRRGGLSMRVDARPNACVKLWLAYDGQPPQPPQHLISGRSSRTSTSVVSGSVARCFATGGYFFCVPHACSSFVQI